MHVLDTAYAELSATSEMHFEMLMSALDRAFDPEGRSETCVAWAFDASRPEALTIEQSHVLRGAPAIWSAMAELSASFDHQTVRKTYLGSLGMRLALQTLALHAPGLTTMARRIYRDHGFADLVALNVSDASGRGAIITWSLEEESKGLESRERRYWNRLAAHVASGLRLQRRSELEVDAVLSPKGRLDHAEAGARHATTRETLRQAVRLRERSRSGRTDAHEALDAYKALVSGRWSLVDRYEENGRRYVVARQNDPCEAKHVALTALETNVARRAAMGHANKLIAYELGVSDSTVSTALTRAFRKLGVRTRVELGELLFMAGAPSD